MIGAARLLAPGELPPMRHELLIRCTQALQYLTYYSLGFEIFYTSWNASPKSRNLRRDARVSAAVLAPLVGQASSRGAQLFGTAQTIARDHPEADRYWEAFRWQSDHTGGGRPLNQAPTDPLTIITARRILYTEHWLRRDEFKPRLTWRPA